MNEWGQYAKEPVVQAPRVPQYGDGIQAVGKRDCRGRGVVIRNKRNLPQVVLEVPVIPNFTIE
jgi:hypothetical protein